MRRPALPALWALVLIPATLSAQKGAMPSRLQAVRAKLIELFSRKTEQVGQPLRRAERLLKEGEIAGAGAALQEAGLRLEDAKHGLHWIRELTPGSRLEAGARYLSVVKVRISSFDKPFVLSDLPDGATRETVWFHRLMRVARRFAPKIQRITARVLETHSVGIRSLPKTLLGRLFPARRRRDLRPGRTIKLRHDPARTPWVRLEEGQEYWPVIGLTFHAVPMIVGGGEPSTLYFVEQAGIRKRRRL